MIEQLHVDMCIDWSKLKSPPSIALPSFWPCSLTHLLLLLLLVSNNEGHGHGVVAFFFGSATILQVLLRNNKRHIELYSENHSTVTTEVNLYYWRLLF